MGIKKVVNGTTIKKGVTPSGRSYSAERTPSTGKKMTSIGSGYHTKTTKARGVKSTKTHAGDPQSIRSGYDGKTRLNSDGSKTRTGITPGGNRYASNKRGGEQATWIGKKDGSFSGVKKESKKVAGKKSSEKGKYL